MSRSGLIPCHDPIFVAKYCSDLVHRVVLNFLANTNQKKYTTFFVLEIELKGCLGPFVLMSSFALSKSRVAYRAPHWEANYYGAVFGH